MAASFVLVPAAFANTSASSQSDDIDLAGSAPQVQSFGDTAQFTPADENGRYTFLIEFNEPGLLEQFRALRTDDEPFNASSPAMQSRLGEIRAQQQRDIAQIGTTLGRGVDVTHHFTVSANGIAARLTLREARAVANLPNVTSVVRERQYELDTFRGPEFIGADAIWSGASVPSGNGLLGTNMVAGVLDSALDAAHPSFANDPACGHGDTAPAKLLSNLNCASTDANGLCNGPAIAPNAHGTHVAATVLGNFLDESASPSPIAPVSGVAPCAHLRHYAVCPSSCPAAQIQAGMDSILLHGDVDVMSFSISGGQSPWTDNDRKKLDLVDAGVFVSASAGNTRDTIPDPVGQVNHRGPWVFTIAASTHDGATGNLLSLEGGPQGALSIQGTGPAMTVDYTGDLRFAGDVDPANVEGCSAFPANAFAGEAALIPRGSCAFADKVNNAVGAGAEFVVVYNNAPGSPIVMGGLDGTSVSAVMVSLDVGNDIIAVLDGGVAEVTVLAEVSVGSDPAAGDQLAGFSLRGPTASPLQNLQKPDITAPGVNIYAAVPGGFGNLSGTSMSSPHVVGAGLLVAQAQPDWTPVEVRSALQMTASQTGRKDNGTDPWDADDVGSGRADLTKAALSGLVMHEVFANFLAANPAAGGDVRTLNLPAVRDVNCSPNCSFTRTVRNTLDVPTSWSISGDSVDDAFDITISPTSFAFTGDLEETQTIEITLTPNGTIPLSFGTIDFVEAGGLSPDLHFTAAIAGSDLDGPPPEGVTGLNFEGTVAGISGDPEGVWASDMRMNVTSPTGATFAVGGFGGGAAPVLWDFDGPGSAVDGTYESSHPDAFFAGTELDGNWTFQFVHTFSPGATMTWDPVTIELTGPTRDSVLATIDIPGFTIAGGASTSVTITIGDSGEIPPTAVVSPTSLETVVEAGEARQLSINVDNIGTEPLVWEAFTAESGNAAGRASTTLFESGPVVTSLGDGPNGADVSLLQTSLGMTTLGAANQLSGDGPQFRMADSFEVPAFTNWSVDEMTFFVYQTGSTTTSSITGVTVEIWDGSPNDPASSVIFGDATTNRLASTDWTNAYRISETTVNTLRPIMEVVADVSGLELTPGTYWVSVQTAGSIASGPWMPPITIIGEASTGNALQLTATGWQNWADGGSGTAQGMPFVVSGSQEVFGCADPQAISWLSVDPTSGSIAGGASASIDVTLDASTLPAGDYDALICLTTNDADAPLVDIPVSLTVIDAGTGEPEAQIDPTSFSFELIEGQSSADLLTIGNIGTADLLWSIEPIPDADGVLLEENFSGADFPPAGWTTVRLAGAGAIEWSRSTTVSNSGGASAHRRFSGSADGFQDDWLITPPIQLGQNSELTFADRGQWMGDYSGSFIQVSTGSCDPADGDFVEVAEIDDSIDVTWREGITVDLSAFDDQEICIGFQYTGDFGHSWWVDDILVTSDPDMPLGIAECFDFENESWLALDPTDGVVQPLQSDLATLTASAAGVPPGVYETNVCIYTNDDAADPAIIPVTMTVIEAFVEAEITPDSFEFMAMSGGTDGGSLSISNFGNVPMSWAISSTETTAGLVGPGVGEVLPESLTDFLLSGGELAPAGEAWVQGTFDCDGAEGLVINDNGTIQNGYSGNPAVASEVEILERYSVPVNGTLGTVCISYLTLAGGPASLDFEIVVRAADGVDGTPGTLLGAVSATAEGLGQGLPPGGIPQWFTVDMSAANITVPAGNVFVGARWEPQSPTNVFLAGDQDSPTTGIAFFRTNGGSWGQMGTADLFANYRHLMVRPQVIPFEGACGAISPPDWLTVSETSGTTDPSDTSLVDVFADAADLEPGLYEAVLCVVTNDPDANLVEVPVEFRVLGDELFQDRFEE
ncbi:MAG: S8 family serine peptidase [Wenzhouxiangella sp.]